MVRAVVDYCPNSVSEYKTIHYRKLKNIDDESFKSDLVNNLASDLLFQQTEFGSTITMYNNAAQGVLDNHAPLITKVVKIVPRAPWFDNEYCLLYTSPSPRDTERSRMPSSA